MVVPMALWALTTARVHGTLGRPTSRQLTEPSPVSWWSPGHHGTVATGSFSESSAALTAVGTRTQMCQLGWGTEGSAVTSALTVSTLESVPFSL